jgi:alkanesulfonate monooxygenase SsuD/methylene tetrahydromethanopterin reductase-like flavin-dependent oxidoreductase (luciferase family)
VQAAAQADFDFRIHWQTRSTRGWRKKGRTDGWNECWEERPMIKPWLFEFLPELGGPNLEPDPQDVATLFARYLDLWVRDEALGFEGIFFSEHHFGRSYSASPNLLIAAIASRTKRLRLGAMGVVLPYYHPARVVEEIGMLDHLTGGRLEIGTAIGVRSSVV